MRVAKLLLKARVPNEGARRLAQYLIGRGPGAIESLARRTYSTPLIVLRLIEGEIEPGEALSYQISLATMRAVVTRDWRDAPAGGWFDPASLRTYRAAA